MKKITIFLSTLCLLLGVGIASATVEPAGRVPLTMRLNGAPADAELSDLQAGTYQVTCYRSLGRNDRIDMDISDKGRIRTMALPLNFQPLVLSDLVPDDEAASRIVIGAVRNGRTTEEVQIICDYKKISK